MTLTPQELLELARKMCGHKFKWIGFIDGSYHAGRVYMGQGKPRGDKYGPIMALEEFNPSLTGEDWQVVQAVAVLKAYIYLVERTDYIDIEAYNNAKMLVFHALRTGDLSAACSALIGRGLS